MHELRVENLCFGYKNTLLQDISFSIKEGEFVGILGPNGCGKSTLARNILHILHPQKGHISYNGEDLSKYSRKKLAQLIGFVPQKSALSMPLLVKDVLYMGRYAHLKNSFGNYSKEDQEIVNKTAKRLNIEHFMERSALSLSGGEFQRVLLARALIGKPQILLLDEPTSALDVNYAIDLMQICEDYVKTYNKMALIVMHDLNLAALFCQRVIFIKEGRIRYVGAAKEVFVPEVLREIYGFESDVIEHRNRPYVLIKK